MTVRRFFIVTTRPADVNVLRKALYDHSRVAGEEHDIPDGRSQGKTISIIETVGRDEADVKFLTGYQKSRLESFLFGVGQDTFTTYTEAESIAGEDYDAYPEMTHALTPAQHRERAAHYLAREFGDDVSEWLV